MDKSVINNYKNEKEKLLISKVIDKIRFCSSKNKIQNTDFLDLAQQKLVENFLKSQKIANYNFFGGFEEAERKTLLFYPKKLEDLQNKIDLDKYINIIRLTAPNDLKGEYNHRIYLGALIKLGIERCKIGDILVDDDGADIIILPEMTKFLLTNLLELTRFNKFKVEQIKLEDLKRQEIKTESIKITIASMRLDNIVAELARCSRTKANEILIGERVLINHEVFTKSSKEVKENDIITIRGKGRFTVKKIIGNTKKGRIFLEVEKFI